MTRARIILAALALSMPAWADGPAAAPGVPSFTPDGQLRRPDDYREWIYLTTGLDMSYSSSMGTMGHSRFDNVFVSASAWRAFLKDGNWPDGTMLVLEVRNARGKGAPTAQRIPMSEDCYSCHREHAAVDTTFVQFYPTLLGIAQSKKTLSAQYLRERAAR